MIANHILEIIHKLNPNSGCALLLGNKSDLKHLRVVEKHEARRLAVNYGVQFMECSASENYDDIHSAFTRLIFEALLVQQAKQFSSTEQKTEEEKPKQRRRSYSSPQSALLFPKDYRSIADEDRLDSLKSTESIVIQSDAHRSDNTQRHQRKNSIRRKISGLGSRIVGSHMNVNGSQNGNR